MRQRIFCAVVVVAVLTLMGPLLTAYSQPKIVIKFHDVSAPTKIAGTAPVVWWMNEVEKRTQGRVKFDRVFGGTLGGWADQLENIRNGVFEIGDVAPTYHPAKTPLGNVAEFPFATNNPAAHAKAMTDLCRHPKFVEEAKKYNQLYLFGTSSDPFQAISKVPIRTLKDFEGLTIRAHGVYASAMKLVGASPAFIASPELFSALEKGIVKAALFAYTITVDYGITDVIKYATDIGGIAIFPYYVSINLNTWEKIPADIQKIMLELAEKVPEKTGEILSAAQKESVTKMKQKGITFFDLSKEEKAKMRKIGGEPLWDQWGNDMNSKGLPGTEIKKLFVEKVRKYEKELKF